MTRQNELLKKGIANLDCQLKDWIIQISKPLETNSFDEVGMNGLIYNLDYPSMPKVDLQKAIHLTHYLALSISSLGSASNFADIYRAARESFVLASLEEIRKSATQQEQSFNAKTIRYDRGTTILIEYYRRLGWIMRVIIRVDYRMRKY